MFQSDLPAHELNCRRNLSQLEQILAETSGDAPGAGLITMVRVMPVERLNSIMVVSPRANYIRTVGEWIDALDSIEDEGSEPTLHVYPVRNGNAAQLATLLSTIYADSGTGRVGGAPTRQGVAPGMTQSSTSGLSSDMPQRNGNSTAGQGASFNLGDGIRIVSDDYNNSCSCWQRHTSTKN